MASTIRPLPADEGFETMEDAPSGELSRAMARILGDAPSFGTGRPHYAHIRSTGRLDRLLGIVVPRPVPSPARRNRNDRPRGGKA